MFYFLLFSHLVCGDAHCPLQMGTQCMGFSAQFPAKKGPCDRIGQPQNRKLHRRRIEKSSFLQSSYILLIALPISSISGLFFRWPTQSQSMSFWREIRLQRLLDELSAPHCCNTDSSDVTMHIADFVHRNLLYLSSMAIAVMPSVVL